MRTFLRRYKRYIELAKNYIRYEIMIGVLLIISSMLAVVNPMLYRVIIDNVLIERKSYLIKYIIIVFVVCYLIGIAIGFLSGLLCTYLGQITSIRLRTMLMRHILDLKVEVIEQCKVGDLISRISEDVATLSSFLSGTLISVFGSALNAISISMLMLFLNPKLTTVALITTVCQIFVSNKFSQITKKNQQDIRECSAINLGILNSIFSSVKSVKAYCKEKFVERKYLSVLKRLKDVSFKSYFIGFSYGSIVSLMSFMGSILILVMGIIEIQNGNMTLGSFFVFDSMMSSFSSFANQLVGLGVSMQGVIVAADRLNAVFDMEVENYNQNVIAPSFEVKIENVGFSYDNHKVYDNLTLRFEERKAYAVIGKSGCGKSTLVNILLNMYQPSKGNVYIGDVPIENIGIRQLREKVSIVFQEAVIISGTLEDNIRYGDYHSSLDKVKMVADISGLNDSVDGKLSSLSTMVEEGGTNLSVGQKQRICLARALLKDADIYVFDETFSSLDAEIGNKIYKRIERYLTDKTRIYITHNLEFAYSIENVIYIDSGKAEFIANKAV